VPESKFMIEDLIYMRQDLSIINPKYDPSIEEEITIV
jgi:hypothetical protein